MTPGHSLAGAAEAVGTPLLLYPDPVGHAAHHRKRVDLIERCAQASLASPVRDPHDLGDVLLALLLQNRFEGDLVAAEHGRDSGDDPRPVVRLGAYVVVRLDLFNWQDSPLGEAGAAQASAAAVDDAACRLHD